MEQYTYWTKQEYLAALENGSIQDLKEMYSRLCDDLNDFEFSARPRYFGEFYSVYIKDNNEAKATARFTIFRNPLVRIYNKLLLLEEEKALCEEIRMAWSGLDDALNPYIKTRKSRRK